jgi:hypothetical protein
MTSSPKNIIRKRSGVDAFVDLMRAAAEERRL